MAVGLVGYARKSRLKMVVRIIGGSLNPGPWHEIQSWVQLHDIRSGGELNLVASDVRQEAYALASFVSG